MDVQPTDYCGSEADIAELEKQIDDAGESASARRLVTLGWYLRDRDIPRALTLAELARSRCTSSDAAERACIGARADLVVARSNYLMNRLDVAGDLAASARAAFETAGDDIGAGDAWVLDFLVQSGRGDPAQAKTSIGQAAQCYRRTGDTDRLRIPTLFQAVTKSFGDAQEAERLVASVECDEGEGASLAEMLSHMVRAVCAFGCSDYVTAALLSERGYHHGLAAGDMHGTAISAANVASACAELNDAEGALQWAEAALVVARPRGIVRALSSAMNRAVHALLVLGRHREARDLSKEAKALLASDPKSSKLWANVCYTDALVALGMDESEEALRDLIDAEAIMRHHADVVGLQSCLEKKGEALSRLGRVEEALGALKEALDVSSTKPGPTSIRASALHTVALLSRRHHVPLPEQMSAANPTIHYLEAALAEAAGIQGHAESADWLCELSRDYEALGDLSRALQCERRAATARAAILGKKATDMATSLHVRHETARAKAEAAYHKTLAESEARRAEAESRRAEAQAQANRAKSTFLANMSHELRSPLNAMLGFTRLLLRDPAMDARREDLGIVMRSGEHLYSLINEVLEMSKIEAGRANLVETDFDLHMLLEELAEMFAGQARQSGVHLQVHCDGAVPQHVRGDSIKLRQVLINLLGNALKFTAQGHVRLQVRAEAMQQLRFEVTDTGPGMSPEELAQVGQPFVQTPAGQRMAEGTGLGLALSHGFVQLMGGTLGLTSVLGEGTYAVFSVPMQEVHQQEGGRLAAGTSRRALALATGTAVQRVLVVDDRADGRLLLMRLLASLGYELREATDGEQAVEAWRQWKPHLILMDMRMPVLDGREATRRIKATVEGRSTVVIALTASSFEEQRTEILAAGCDDFLRKPFQEEVLLEMMARHLGVQYVYESAKARPGEAVPELTVHQLAGLPSALRERLIQALERLDVAAIERAIEAVKPHDEACAAGLAPMVKRFEYARIAELLAAAG